MNFILSFNASVRAALFEVAPIFREVFFFGFVVFLILFGVFVILDFLLVFLDFIRSKFRRGDKRS